MEHTQSGFSSAPRAPLSTRRLLATSIITKFFVNTGVQLWGPFLPVIAQGLDTSVVTMGRLTSVRSIMGVFAPIFGSAADRTGYRRMLRLSLWILVAGTLIVGLSPNISVALIGMILMGLGSSGFIPTLQAYVSAQLPYNRRARGIGILEYAWALTGIVGLFLVGQLITVAGWRAPFLVLAGATLAMSFVFHRMPPARMEHAPEQRESPAGEPWTTRLANFFNLGVNARSAYSSMIASCFLYFAAVQLMISYGIWLQSDYGLGPAQLGTVALILGLFDLMASVTMSIITDRVGKRRSMAIGVSGALIACLLLPELARGLVSAVLALAVTRSFFEFAIVSNLPLLSEQIPAQRGKVMTLGAATGLIGSTLSGLTAPWLFTRFGLAAVTWTSALSAAISLIILLLFVSEHGIMEPISHE